MDCYQSEKQFVDLSKAIFRGRILDIGGGGEGIISRHSGDKVTAIDKRADELAETPDIGLKIVMDACNLGFLDGYFDNITCFYTLMYMTEAHIQTFLKEAKRVIKKGGKLWIWDAIIPQKPLAQVFIAQLKVKVSPNLTIETGYGVAWERGQCLKTVKEHCEKVGFRCEQEEEKGQSFFLQFKK